MRALFVIFFAAVAALASEPTPSPSPTPVPATVPPLRVRLMDLGGALSNDGFKIRDRIWSGKVAPGEPSRLAVNLFRGNHYWFAAAADPEVKNLKVSLFGPDGARISGLEHREAGLAAVGVTAETTGQYFVQVETSGGPSSDFCLLYLFK